MIKCTSICLVSVFCFFVKKAYLSANFIMMLKRLSIIICALTIFSLAARAKTDTLFYYMKTVGYTEVPTMVKDSAEFYRMILPPDNDNAMEDGISELFVVKDYYMNKKPRMIGQTIKKSPYLELEGPNIEFFPNGKRKAIRNFDKNKPVGEITEYFPSGEIYLIGRYDHYGNLMINECRDSTGNVTVTNGNGHYIIYSENFKSIAGEGLLSNDVREGEWHGQLNDSISYICNYKNGVGQNGISYDKKGRKYPFTSAEIEPKYKGGIENFYKFLMQNVHYPKVAKENYVQGKVFITFVVDRDGSLINISLVRGIGSGCDEEALRVIRSSPKWIPGYLYGLPVRVQYTVPISFSLTKNY